MDTRPEGAAQRRDAETEEGIVVDLRAFADRLNQPNTSSLEAALLEAEAIIEEARREADAIVAAAEHRASVLRAEARSELAAAHRKADEVGQEAQKVLGRAHRKAQRLVEEARLDADLVRRSKAQPAASPSVAESLDAEVAVPDAAVVTGSDEPGEEERESMYSRRGRKLPRIGSDGGDLGQMLGRLRRSSAEGADPA